MQLVQAQSARRLPLTKETGIGHDLTFHRLRALFGVPGRRRLPRRNVVPNYEGCGWCDSTEQQVIAGIVTCRRTAI